MLTEQNKPDKASPTVERRSNLRAEGHKSRSNPGTAPTQLLLLEGCSATRRTSSRELSAYSLAGKSRGGSLPLEMHKNNPPKQAALIYPWSTNSVQTESPVFSHFPSVCLVSAVSGMLTGKTWESSLLSSLQPNFHSEIKQSPKHNLPWIYSRDISLPNSPCLQWVTLWCSQLGRGSCPTLCPPASSLCHPASHCQHPRIKNTAKFQHLVQDFINSIATCTILFYVWLQLAGDCGSARA